MPPQERLNLPNFSFLFPFDLFPLQVWIKIRLTEEKKRSWGPNLETANRWHLEELPLNARRGIWYSLVPSQVMPVYCLLESNGFDKNLLKITTIIGGKFEIALFSYSLGGKFNYLFVGWVQRKSCMWSLLPIFFPFSQQHTGSDGQR